MAKKVLIPLPQYGFDPTESSVPWKYIKDKGHSITFATPDGTPAQADRRMVTGEGLPFLLKRTLMALPDAVALYDEMSRSPEFVHPVSYGAVNPDSFDGLLLPGGHDKGMRIYLESGRLQEIVATFFENQKPVGAICHGTLLAARSRSAAGKSVLWGRKTTGLTRNQEMIAYYLTCYKLGDYYRTYSVPMATELISYLRSPADYLPGPGFPIPVGRDSQANLKPGFTVRDGNYVSARWPGDAHKFAVEFIGLLS